MENHKIYFGAVPGMSQDHKDSMEKELRKQIPNIDYKYFGDDVLTSDEFIKECGDAEVIITWDQEMDDKVYTSLESLKAYCAASVGFNGAHVDIANKYGIIVTNAGDYCVEEVATHTVALILACNRKLKLMNKSVMDGEWNCSVADPLLRFSESTVGLFGFGSIGRLVAKFLSGFGCKILTADPYANLEQAKKLDVEIVDLKTLSMESDFISIHAPLLESTKLAFNKDLFKIMKDSVCIVNTSRGKIIDNTDLYDALNSGKVSFVGLDVLENEPPKESDKKIIEHPHSIVTPHAAYNSTTATKNQIINTVRCVRDIVNNKLPEFIVNPEAINKIKWFKE